MGALGARLFSDPADAAVWRLLARSSLAASSWASYDSKFATFVTFCHAVGRPALPASTHTVLRYIVHLFREDRVHGRSLQPYLSAINRVHRDLGLRPPALGHAVSAAQRGFIALHESAAAPQAGAVTTARGARRLPLPAGVAFAAAQLGTSTSDGLLRCACAIVVHAFLFCARASSVVGVPVSAYAFADDGALIFREDFRKTGGPSRHLRVPFIPLPASGAHPLRFLRHFWRARLQRLARPADAHNTKLFYHPQLPAASAAGSVSAALTHVLHAVGVAAPPGGAFSSHSMRSGAASAATAIGVPLPTLMAWGGWRSLSSVQRYLDPTVVRSDAAAAFFAFLRP